MLCKHWYPQSIFGVIQELPCIPIDIHVTLGGCKKTVPWPCYNLILFSSVYVMSLGHLGAPRITLELET